ncbi:phage portal protein [Sinanaerobacter chloroacetimidivorans]|uniref:Phage portal protein n=1 Tax=Sinanaerobacter chloroacetimidivorans TaxID=2818044 RepID=A0A8J7W4S6_9FIRM|nr:phage portal protein [Sinanaerobacter chloroacetimidivorans]MBR0599041.1 phage portal protein [Sinanaerobacter chloroacetimidivorans]
MLNGYNNRITSFNGGIYDDDTVRACVDAIARHFAKMKPTHKLKNVEQSSNLNKLLSLRPNTEMSSYDFLYKICTNLYIENNAYIYIRRDSFGNIIGLYPVLYNQAELIEDRLGNFYLRFNFSGSQTITESIENIIVLRKHFYKNDFYGESNHQTLNPVINLLYTINQGIIQAVKTSGLIRGILKLVGMLQGDDKTELKKQFEEDYLSAQNSGGIAVTDDRSTYIPIESKPILVDDKNTALAKDKVYTYFGVSEGIVKGKYTEDEWQSFYESVLEPLAISFSQEFTAKIFTQREIDFGNTVVFIADRLSYMNTKSKIDMIVAVKELGVLNKGQLAEILNLSPPPDAEEYLQSLNYINSKIANQYQLNNGKEGEKVDGE